MKNTRRMRKLPFSCSTPRGDRTTNIEPNIASDLFCHALYSMYACISNKPTPELFILIFAASFLLVDRFFTTILNILGKLSLQNWRCCNVHGPLPYTLSLRHLGRGWFRHAYSHALISTNGPIALDSSRNLSRDVASPVTSLILVLLHGLYLPI